MRVKTTPTTRRVRRSWMGISFAAALLVVVTASAALAQETQLDGKLRSGQEVLVPVGETVEGDLYASGGLVRIEGTVDGDLLVSAGQVQVTGEVTGDVIAAGGALDLAGEVAGDARVAGGQVAITGTVGEDLVAAGGQVTLASSAEVGEDVLFGAGRVALDGAVAGDVLGTAGSYVRRGTIGGTENVTIQQPDDAVPTVTDRVLRTLGRLVSVLAIAALALWLAPRLVDASTRTLRTRPLLSLVVGIAGLVAVAILVPVLIVVAVVLAIALAFVGLGDLVGIVVLFLIAALVLLALVLALALGFGAPAFVGMALADLAVPSGAANRRWWALIIGVLVVVVVSALPVVGGWFAFVIALLGFGALLLALFPREPKPEAVEPAPQQG